MADNEQFLVTPQTSAQITQQTSVVNNEAAELRALELKRARHYLMPSIAGIVGYIVAALVLLLVLNWSTIFAAVNSTSGGDPRTLTESIKYYADNQIVSWATIILFWGTVGLAVYTLFWLGSAFITAARNEMIVETAFSRRGHFWDKIRVPLIKLVLLAAVAIIFVLSLKYSVPALADLGSNAIFVLSSSPLMSLAYFIGALLGAMINLYILTTLVTFFRHADGIF